MSIEINNKRIKDELYIIAGQCTIDINNKNLFLETADALKEVGVDAIRGGVWKPRTLPNSYQGDDKSLDIIVEAKKKTGLPIVVEIMEEYQIQLAMDAGVDVFQIGARNSLNYGFLKQIGKAISSTDKIKVLHKRPMHMGDIDGWIGATRYISDLGNENIMFCLRGFKPAIAGFRNTPDESMTLLLKEKVKNPVIVDPSHAVGKSEYVPMATMAAVSYGADGLIIESHIAPDKGIGDDPKQSITPLCLKKLIPSLKKIHEMNLNNS